MYSIVQHNANGTVYGFVRGFATIEEAEQYRSRWGHTGVGHNSPIIATENEEAVRRINDLYSPEARRLSLISNGLRRQFDEDWYDFLHDTITRNGQPLEESQAHLSEEAWQGVLAARERLPARLARAEAERMERVRQQEEQESRRRERESSGWYNDCPGDVAARDCF